MKEEDKCKEEGQRVALYMEVQEEEERHEVRGYIQGLERGRRRGRKGV